MTTDHRHATVGQVMALDLVVIRANAPLDQAVELMDRHHLGGLPVVDSAGILVGVVSQADLVRARSAEYLWANWSGLAVRHLVVVADDDETLPIGIVTASDFVHDIAVDARAARTPRS